VNVKYILTYLLDIKSPMTLLNKLGIALNESTFTFKDPWGQLYATNIKVR